jgi:hypothetical protein
MFQLLLFGGWVNRREFDGIKYFLEENRILKARFGGRRLRITDGDRLLLARKVTVEAMLI